MWNSAADVDGNGLPDTNATLANVTANGVTPSFADTLSFTAQNTPGSYVPGPSAAGIPGTVSGSVAITAGSATSSNVNYPEVGSFSLSATPTTDYLSSGVNLSNRIAVYANPSSSTRSAWVGRFKPNNFVVAASNFINRSEIGGGVGCAPASNFAYMGENINLSFTLSAMNALGGLTRNYAGSYAKLDGTNWFAVGTNNSLGVGAMAQAASVSGGSCNVTFDFATPSHTAFKNCNVAAPADILRAAGPRLSTVNAPVASNWLLGQASFSADLMLQRADSADGPYTFLQLGFAPLDGDAVGLAAGSYNMDADQDGSNERSFLKVTQVRYGRMLIDNAYGSELLPLPVAVQAQYWSGGQYVKAVDDNCTPLLRANFLLNAHSGGVDGIDAGNMNAANIPANSGNMLAGQGTIRLLKPGTVHPIKKGSVTLNSLLSYLPGAGRLTFGLYKAGPVIYIREIY
ncbi:MAG: hypothetical protein HYZ45_05295 [Burkholderiales bacterium]|nr:hypothetical protein [Burkholderiales bacterium]